MKYYIYISETKVNMLFDQIPETVLKKLAGELGINLVFITGKISTKRSKRTLYSKLNLIVKHFEKNEPVGTVDMPQFYFTGTLPMRWGPYRAAKGAIFFGGYSDTTIVGLSGSQKHLITRASRGKVGDYLEETGASEIPFIQDLLFNEVRRARGNISEKEEYRIPNPWYPAYPGENEDIALTDARVNSDILYETQWVTASMEGLTERVEFLAVKLAQGPASLGERWERDRPKRGWGRDLTKHRKCVLLGSPIYVARASEHQDELSTKPRGRMSWARSLVDRVGKLASRLSGRLRSCNDRDAGGA